MDYIEKASTLHTKIVHFMQLIRTFVQLIHCLVQLKTEIIIFFGVYRSIKPIFKIVEISHADYDYFVCKSMKQNRIIFSFLVDLIYFVFCLVVFNIKNKNIIKLLIYLR